jgi:hypothetical protein
MRGERGEPRQGAAVLFGWVATGVAAIMLAAGIYAGLHFVTGVTAVTRFNVVAQQKGMTPNEANEFMRDLAAMMAPPTLEKNIRMPDGAGARLTFPDVEPIRSAGMATSSRMLDRKLLAERYAQLEQNCISSFNRNISENSIKLEKFDITVYSLKAGYSDNLSESFANLITCMTREMRERLCFNEYRSIVSSNITNYFDKLSYVKTQIIHNLGKNIEFLENSTITGASSNVGRMQIQLDTVKRLGPNRTMLGHFKALIAEGYLHEEDFSGIFTRMTPEVKDVFNMTQKIESRCKI